MNQLTPIQEMAAKDLLSFGFLERTPGSRYFEGLNSRYRWDTIRPLVELGYARIVKMQAGRIHYPLRIQYSVYPDAAGLCYGLIPAFWLLEGDRPDKFKCL